MTNRAIRPWLVPLLVLLLSTAVSALLERYLDHANIIMIYMAGMIYVAQREGRAAALAVVAGSILIFDCLFVAPRWSFTPIDPQYYFTFVVMGVVGWLISHFAERARREAAAASQAAVAVESERLRSTLLSGISHDFRTPLTTIVGSATSLLQQGHMLDEAHRRALLEGVLGEAQRLHALSSGLLDLTRMESGVVRPQCEWCPADELIEEARLATGARLHQHALRTELPADVVVWGDPRLLDLALVNLLENVARHTPPGTAVTLRIGTAPGWWSLQVHDNGPGLPPGGERGAFTTLPRPAAAVAGSGAGLGLALCAAVARLHGGHLEAMNDRGARITLTLPLPPGMRLPGAESP